MSTYVIHSNRKGVLQSISCSEDLRGNINKVMYKSRGDVANKFENAADLLGIIFLQFKSKHELDAKLNCIEDLIKVNVAPI